VRTKCDLEKDGPLKREEFFVCDWDAAEQLKQKYNMLGHLKCSSADGSGIQVLNRQPNLTCLFVSNFIDTDPCCRNSSRPWLLWAHKRSFANNERRIHRDASACDIYNQIAEDIPRQPDHEGDRRRLVDKSKEDQSFFR
jgi:hypothetical protein